MCNRRVETFCLSLSRTQREVISNQIQMTKLLTLECMQTEICRCIFDRLCVKMCVCVCVCVEACVHGRIQTAGPLQVSSSSFPFLLFLLRVGRRCRGVFHSLFCCCWGERERESESTYPYRTLSPGPFTPTPLPQPHYTQTHTKTQLQRAPAKDYFSQPHTGSSVQVWFSCGTPPLLAALGTAQAFLPSSFHTWRGSLSQAIADKLQTRQPPLPSPPTLSQPLFLSHTHTDAHCTHPCSSGLLFSILTLSTLSTHPTPFLRMWGPH